MDNRYVPEEDAEVLARSSAKCREPAWGAGSEAYAWHFDMLHDKSRLKSFEDAFCRLPEEAACGLAVDIGCGSGVLGLTLLRRRPTVHGVIALDSDANLVGVARANAELSGLASRWQGYACRSTSLSSLPSYGRDCRGTLLVCEIFDSGLLGEDCLPTIRHAASHLLSSGYHAVPAQADVIGCLVESKCLASWQHLVRNRRSWPERYWNDNGDGNPHDVALDRLIQTGYVRVLSDEFMAFRVDFEQLPPAKGQSVLLTVELLEEGRVDAVVFWWRCHMIRGDACVSTATFGGMTNAPFWGRSTPSAEYQEVDHWRQAVCVLPRSTEILSKGEIIKVLACHDDEDVWFRVVSSTVCADSATLSVPRSTSRLSLWSSSRLWALADDIYANALRQGVRKAVADFALWPRLENGGFLALDLSDGPLLGLAVVKALAARLGRQRSRYGKQWPVSVRMRRFLRYSGHVPLVLSLESTREDLMLAQDIVTHQMQSLRKCWRGSVTIGLPRFELILGSPMLSPQSVTLVVAEPFARACEGQSADVQLWQHWAQLDALSWSFQKDVALVPRRFRLCAALVECSKFWQRRQPLSSSPIDGVELDAINALHPDAVEERCNAGRKRRRFSREGFGTSFRTRVAVGLWRIQHRVLSGSAVICDVNLRAPLPRRWLDFPSARLATSAGVAHAVATWPEVEIFDGAWMPTAAPMGSIFPPSHGLQGVLLATTPRSASNNNVSLEVRARFDAGDGSLRLKAVWSDGCEY